MKRGIYRRRNRLFRVRSGHGLRQHMGCVPLMMALWLGIVTGVVTYDAFVSTAFSEWRTALHFGVDNGGILNIQSILSTAFLWFVILAILFLAGQCAFGWPIIVAAEWIAGFQIGMHQCGCYQQYGWGMSMLLSCLPALMYMTAVVGMGERALHVSSAIAKGVLSYGNSGIHGHRCFLQSVVWLPVGIVFVLIAALIQTGMKIVFGQ